MPSARCRVGLDSEPTGIFFGVGVLLVFLFFAVLSRANRFRGPAAGQGIDSGDQQEYPEEVKSWGGVPVLHSNRDAIRTIVQNLSRNPALMPPRHPSRVARPSPLARPGFGPHAFHRLPSRRLGDPPSRHRLAANRRVKW